MDNGVDTPRPSPDNAAERLPRRDFVGKDNRPLTVKRVLSEDGVQAQVLEAVYQDTGEPVAIKFYRDKKVLARGDPHDFAQVEADALKLLTENNVPHIPKFHSFYKGIGRGDRNRSYIVMDLAAGEDALGIMSRNGFSEAQALAVTRQAWECLAAASAAGIMVTDAGIKGVMFNPENNKATFIDWGGAVRLTNPPFGRGANSLYVIGSYDPSEMGIADPQLDASKALKRLKEDARKATCSGKKTDSGVELHSFSNAGTGIQFAEMLDRIFSGESYSSLESEIDAFVHDRSTTIAQNELMEPAQLAKIMPPHQLVNKYFEMLIGHIPLQDRGDIFSPVYGLSSLTGVADLKSLHDADYLASVQLNAEEILARPEFKQIHAQTKFILSVAESFVDPEDFFNSLLYRTRPGAEPLSRDDRMAIYQTMNNVYMDMMTLGLRPDLATEGNRARLREGLGKLSQYLTPEQKAQGQQILASLQIPRFEVPAPQVVAPPEVVVPATPEPEKIVAAAPQIAEELPTTEAVLPVALEPEPTSEPEQEDAKDENRYPEITTEMRDQKLNELAPASRAIYELWRHLALNEHASNSPIELLNGLKNGQDIVDHKAIDFEDNTIKQLLYPLVFLEEVITDLHSGHRLGWLRKHGFDYNQVSRCILDCLLFDEQTPRDTLNEAKRFMHALTADQSIRESLVGEWKQIPPIFKEAGILA